MYQFEKYGILMWYRGIPFYGFNRCLTDHHPAIWWPINWVVVPVIVLVVAIKVLFKKFKKDKS